VLRLLSRAFRVTALCFERTGVSGKRHAYDPRIAIEALRPFADLEVFAVPQTRSRMRFVWDHTRSTVSRRVYTRYLYESPSFQERLEGLLRTRSFDLVHVDSLDLSRYLPACAGLPTVCVHHNVESALLRRRGQVEGNALSGRYYAYQARLMEREERYWTPRVSLNVVVSEPDLRLLQGLAPGARLCMVPNGVDVEEFAPAGTEGEALVYVGGTNWFPNLDALEFFCQDILPRLRERGFEPPVRWVGSASEEQRNRFARAGIELTGYVDDVKPFMHDSLCHIVPLRSGGGTRLKILNSWATGKPVVSTSVGCEGLRAIDGENILMRDDSAGFAEAILELARDAGLRKRLGEAGRRTVVEHYGWDVIGDAMVTAYRALLPGSPT
jgi:glycosyltransferase involved in cell wall biosynthesis